jgi:hypothetical protein
MQHPYLGLILTYQSKNGDGCVQEGGQVDGFGELVDEGKEEEG